MSELFLGLRCTRCGAEHDADRPAALCRSCPEGFLDCVYDYDAIAARLDWTTIRLRESSIWRWKELLPVRQEAPVVTLGEGGTPLLRCERLARHVGVRELWVKDDAMTAPTGSLKDRSMAVAVTKAVEFGRRTICVDTTGNKGASAAGYAARAGLACVVFCDAATTPEKLYQMLMYGATVVRLDAPFAEVSAFLRSLVRSGTVDWYYCGRENPYRYEGKKTYAYEVVESLRRAPDVILHPSAGSLSVVKTWKGYQELINTRLWSGTPPRMVAVQAAACAPIVAAHVAGRVDVSPVVGQPTMATAIASGNPGPMGTLTLGTIAESGGTAIGVEEDEIQAATIRLSREGIFVEPSAATGLAAAERLAKTGWLAPDVTVVIDVTGVGFKDLSRMGKWLDTPPVLPPSTGAVMDYVRRTGIR